jgi:hypothetical protein
MMMYPFMQLEDKTEIVHSEMLENETVKVYIEKPVEGGFHSAVCYLPEYRWEEKAGFTGDDIERLQEFLESTAHLIIRFAREGGFGNAASF